MTTRICKSVCRRAVGDAVRRERQRRRISVADLSALSGVKTHTIYDIESGRAGTSVGTFLCVVLAMGADAGRMMATVQRQLREPSWTK